jgi:ABC-2 type transport system permease protein
MIFHIAFKDLKVLFKDKKALLLLLLMPALIMLILGTALGSMFTEDSSIKKFPIAVVNKDDGIMSGIFINMVLGGEMSKMLKTYIVDEDKANHMLEKKIVPSVIIIPEDFSENINNLKDVKIKIKSDADDKTRTNIVESVAKGYAYSTSMSYEIAGAVTDTLKRYGSPLPSPAFGMSQTTMVMGELQKKINSEVVKFTEEDKEKAASVSAIQYYSAAMLIMFLMFSAMSAISFMVEERENKTLNRIMGTRATKMKLIVGKCLGLLLIGLVQALILIVFTRLVYRVDWGENWFGVALVTLCAVFACSGLGLFVAAISKSLKAANGMGTTMVQVLTALGGGMVPIYVLPGFIRNISNVTPNWQAMDGYYKLMQGSVLNAIVPNCLVLALIGIVFLSIGILKFRTL